MNAEETNSEKIEKEVLRLIDEGKLPPSGKIPSLRQLAKQFKVNKTTVYRVIQKLHNLNRVEIVSGKGVYALNPQQAVSNSITDNCISWIVPDLTIPHIPAIAKGLDSVITKENFYLASYSSSNNFEVERENLKRAMELNSKGIILFPVTALYPYCPNYDIYAEVIRSGIPFVFVDNYPILLDVDYIVPDELQGIYDITKYLIKMGHKRIAFLNSLGSSHTSTAIDRERGFWRAMMDAGLEIDVRLVMPNPSTFFDRDTTRANDIMAKRNEYLARILTGKNPPSALIIVPFFSEDFDVIRNKGWRIPENISVCSVSYEYAHDYNFLKSVQFGVSVDITHSIIPALELGKKAAEVIVQKAKGKDKNQKVHMKIPMELYLGNSVQRRNKTLNVLST